MRTFNRYTYYKRYGHDTICMPASWRPSRLVKNTRRGKSKIWEVSPGELATTWMRSRRPGRTKPKARVLGKSAPQLEAQGGARARAHLACYDLFVMGFAKGPRPAFQEANITVSDLSRSACDGFTWTRSLPR